MRQWSSSARTPGSLPNDSSHGSGECHNSSESQPLRTRPTGFSGRGGKLRAGVKLTLRPETETILLVAGGWGVGFTRPLLVVVLYLFRRRSPALSVAPEFVEARPRNTLAARHATGSPHAHRHFPRPRRRGQGARLQRPADSRDHRPRRRQRTAL